MSNTTDQPNNKENNEGHSKKIAKNSLYLYFRMILVMAVSLYTSRVVLKILGVEDFGIYNVVGGVVVMFSFIQNALTTSLQRSLNVELGKQNITEASLVFNSAMIVYIIVCLALILLAETIGLWYIKNYLNIPEGSYDAVFWVYQLTIITTIIQIMQIPYNAVIIAYEKMSFYAYMSIVDVVLKLAILYALIYIEGYRKVIVYAFLILLVTFMVFITYKIYVNLKFHISRFQRKYKKQHFYDLMSFSGWSMLGAVSVIAVSQGSSLMLNFFYGVVLNTSMGIANQVGGAINRLVGGFQTAFTPQIMKSYAQNDMTYLRKMVLQTSKYSFFLMFFLSLPILIETDYVLNLWLTEMPDYIVPFVQFTIFYMLIDTMSTPFLSVIYASGNIKQYQIRLVILYITNLLLTFIFLKIGFSPVWIMIVRIFVNIATLIMRINITDNLIVLSKSLFFKEAIIPLMNIILISIIPPICLYILMPVSLFRFILVIITSGISVLFSVYFFGLSCNEKNKINIKIKSILKI